MSFHRTVVLVVLPLLSILGAYGTWVLGGTNGLFVGITQLLEQNRAFFPGSTDPILRQYTGIGPIDHQLQILVTFFAPVVDVRNGDLVLFSIFGAGQFGGAWVIMMMESLRLGNKGRIISFVGTVGFILQNLSFTITVPLYLFLHLLTSPTANLSKNNTTVLLIPALDLAIIPISLLLGYIVPSILMCLPVSTVAHQQFIAFWQPFPIWTVIIQSSLRFFASQLSNVDNSAPTKSPGESYLDAAKPVYRFVFALCMITHISVIAIALLPPTTLIGYSPALTHLLQSTFADVYIPYGFDLNHKVSGFAAGALNFLHWDMYVGSIAFLFWVSVLYRDASNQIVQGGSRNGGVWWKVAWKIPTYTLISGPIGALAVLLCERDAITRQKVKKGI